MAGKKNSSRQLGARSPRMAETLSMESLKTGVRGPQSSGNAMPPGYDLQSFQDENRRLGYSTAEEFRRLDAMDSNADAMTPKQTERHGALMSRMTEVAAGFAAANKSFSGARARSSAKSGGQSDGYVGAHTRRQGTKVVQVEKHQRKPK